MKWAHLKMYYALLAWQTNAAWTGGLTLSTESYIKMQLDVEMSPPRGVLCIITLTDRCCVYRWSKYQAINMLYYHVCIVQWHATWIWSCLALFRAGIDSYFLQKCACFCLKLSCILMLTIYFIFHHYNMPPTLQGMLDKTDFMNFCLAELWSDFPVKLFTVDGELWTLFYSLPILSFWLNVDHIDK